MTPPNSKLEVYKAHSEAGMSIEEAAAAMGTKPATVRQYAREKRIHFRGLVFSKPVPIPAPKIPRKGVATWVKVTEFGQINRASLVAIPGVQIRGAA